MLVVAVGAESEWGRTMALVATEAQPTPLQVPRLPRPLPSAGSISPALNVAIPQPLLGHATGLKYNSLNAVWLLRMR